MKASAKDVSIISAAYQGVDVHFTGDAWFNASDVAGRFNKSPNEWLRLPSTKEYIAALERKYGKIPYLKTKRGQSGGTWLHPKLAVPFSRWLDVDFSVWCDEQIDSLLRAPVDWDRDRVKAATSFKLLTDMVKIRRENEGKEAASHHFSNEARLINYAMTGKFDGVDRDQLSAGELQLLVFLEERDIMFLGTGKSYEERKAELVLAAENWRQSRATPFVRH